MTDGYFERDWVIRWLLKNLGLTVSAESPLRGDIDSLLMAELLTAAEYELSRDAWSDFTPACFDTVETLSQHLANSPAGVEKHWYRPLDETGRLGAAHDGFDRARTSLGDVVVGAATRPAATGRTGSVMLVGEPAVAITDLVADLDAAVAAFDPTSVWYPMLTNAGTGRDHPQNVASSLETGRLQHAACLELLEELDERPDGLYCGIGYAYRREPARRWDSAGRLEAYRVWEAVWCGPTENAPTAMAEIKRAVAAVLDRFSKGDWAPALDGFTPGVTRKSEWTVADDEPRAGMAVSSLNDHGTTFVRDGRSSFCLGVGIDRLADLDLLWAHTNERTIPDGDPGAGTAVSSPNDHGTTFARNSGPSFCLGVGIDRLHPTGLDLL
ncbi:hypothetical protein AB5J55_19040 [Streptomyces sp. R11]|uniref:Carrier domain-containing protein n=1 Tax=Streptomyces sp. R11 TaxID=3238625 RepID=A0AB39N2S7_9ACTN